MRKGLIALLFFIPSLCFGAIDDPDDLDFITDDATDFLISGTANGSYNSFVFYAPDGGYICKDAIASPYGTMSMSDLMTACGTSGTLGNGAYETFLVDNTGGQANAICNVDGNADLCFDTWGVAPRLCLEVGTVGACSAGGITSSSSTSTMQDAVNVLGASVFVFFGLLVLAGGVIVVIWNIRHYFKS